MKIKIHIAILDNRLLVALDDPEALTCISTFPSIDDLNEYVGLMARDYKKHNYKHCIVEVET